MADKKLLSLLKHSGVDAWNRARVSHPDYPNSTSMKRRYGAPISLEQISRAQTCALRFFLERTSKLPIFAPPIFPARGFTQPT